MSDRAAAKQRLRLPTGTIEHVAGECGERPERIFCAAAQRDAARLWAVMRRHWHGADTKAVHAGLHQKLLVEDEIV